MRRLLFVLLVALAAVPAARAWTWPTDGQMLQPFSFDPASPYAAGQHRGIDLAGSVGEAVHAPRAGVVSFAGTVPGSGKSVTIETADGWSVTLTHLGTLSVKQDASVGEGDVIAGRRRQGSAVRPARRRSTGRPPACRPARFPVAGGGAHVRRRGAASAPRPVAARGRKSAPLPIHRPRLPG
jgi:hypothetical protein